MKYGLYLLMNVDVIDNYYMWVVFILVCLPTTCFFVKNEYKYIIKIFILCHRLIMKPWD